MVRIDRRTLRHVDRLAERLGISRSALIRRSVAKLLADTKSGADSAA
ncbi:MAG TPA: ribbon-helix-helix protein, CopG family [Acidimicrobiia bacterium]|nr:ribbon-helix-helix protein, CopG family [Acidimicrobiia bacterium]